jgi:glycosyltransferase involved in cell wall biosynthesis
VKVCALIPAYNEEMTIGNIVRETKKYIDSVIVVDNGSTDASSEIARRWGAEVINYSLKRGYGAAQYAGHQHAIYKGFEYILQLDADGQHDPIYIPELLKTMEQGNYDIVLGSRFLETNDTNTGFVRNIGIKFFSKTVSLFGNVQITDVTSGFKVYKVSSLKQLHKPSDTHPAVEQMMEIAKKGMRIREIPIKMSARNSGSSHLSLPKFALYPIRAIWILFKVLLFRH